MDTIPDATCATVSYAGHSRHGPVCPEPEMLTKMRRGLRAASGSVPSTGPLHHPRPIVLHQNIHPIDDPQQKVTFRRVSEINERWIACPG